MRQMQEILKTLNEMQELDTSFTFGKATFIYFLKMTGKEKAPQTSSMFYRFILGTGIEIIQSTLITASVNELRYFTYSWQESSPQMWGCFMDFILFIHLFILSKYNWFTMLCQFLLHSEVNQPYTYTHPLPLRPPSPHIPPNQTIADHRLSSLCYTSGSHYLFYTWQCIYAASILKCQKSHLPQNSSPTKCKSPVLVLIPNQIAAQPLYGHLTLSYQFITKGYILGEARLYQALLQGGRSRVKR